MPRLTLLVVALTACTGPSESPPRGNPPDDGGNTPPVATIGSLEAGTPGPDGSTVRLEGVVSDAEDAPEDLVAFWVSSLSGLLDVDTPPDADGLVSGSIELERGEHELTLWVEDTRGLQASDSATITVTGAAPPTVTLLAPRMGDVLGAGEALRFEAQVDDPDQDAATLSVSWSSDRDGVLSTAGADATGHVEYVESELARGPHVITLVATDADGMTGSDSVSITINGLPDAPTVSISPTDARTLDDLVVSIDVPSTDPEGDAITYAFAWTRDGVGAGNTDTVSSTSTAKGEHWVATVTPLDPFGSGEPAVAETWIGNSPPVLLGVDILPQPLFTDSVAVGTVTVDDPDSDPITATWAWTVDGSPAGTDRQDLDGAVWFDRGQQVGVEVFVDDGTEVTPPLSATPVLVANSPPTAAAVSIDPALPVDVDDLLCQIDAPAYDADGDAVTYVFDWDADGVPFAGTATTLEGGDTVTQADTAPLEVWTCAVTPDDGLEVGPVAAASVTVCPGEPEVCDGLDNDCDGVIDGPGVCDRRVFVTADPVTTDFGGATGADQICQDAADLAGLGGTWMAWVSDSTTSPATRFRLGTDDFVRLDGVLVASSWLDLTSGSVAATLTIDQYGGVQGNHEVWTHTTTSGTAMVGSPCDDWTSTDPAAPFGEQGLAMSTNGSWTAAYAQTCDRADDHLYCFEQ